jgi:osmotically-inducible protein OsmY
MKTDVQLQRDVLDQLGWEPSIDASRIGVTCCSGVVTLTGHVPTHTERHTAAKATKRVHGVRAVANEIAVHPSDSHQRDDEQIASAAVHALEWDGQVPDTCIQLTVRKGWIVLDGEVRHRFQRDAAERAVRHLIGVRGVTNNIEVSPGAVPESSSQFCDRIKGEIENAIRRSALLQSPVVTVEVTERSVILTGDVRSHPEYDEVERIAWTTRDVPGVENCMTITPWGDGPMEEWGY